MADNPFDAFDAKPANPFDAFDEKPAPKAPPPATTTSPPPAGQDLGTTALWNKPANTSWNDYLMAHLASAVRPLGGIADPHQNINEGLAFGSGLSGGLSSLIPGVRERTAQAEQELAPQTRIALEGAGYIAGPGKLGIASKIGNAIAPEGVGALAKVGQWGAGLVGSGLESAGATATGDIGRGNTSNIGRDMLLGGGIGMLGGVPGGIVGRGGTLPGSPSAQSYFDQAKQEYKPLTQLLYDAKSEVHPQIGITDAKNAQRDWSGYKWDDAPKTQSEINTLLDKPQLSANDIQQAHGALGKVQGNPNASANDQNYAGYYRNQLQNVLENGMPQTGVPANLPPGVTPSNYAAYVKSKGDFLTGQARDMQRADVWKAVGATPAGKDIGAQTGAWLSDQAAREAANKPGVWAQSGTPYNEAATALAKTTGQSTPLSWYAKHFVLAPLAFTAAGEGINAATGGEGMGHQPWWARLGEEGAAGLALGGGAAGYKALTGASNVAEQQAAEAALRRTIASRTMQNPAGTYRPVGPVLPPAPLRDMIRQIIYGQGAAGRLPGQ